MGSVTKMGLLKEMRSYAVITLSLTIGALGWGAFIIPSDIVGGGVVGIASIVYYVFVITFGIINCYSLTSFKP